KSQILVVDPALQQFHDYLAQLESIYAAYRLRLERMVAADAGKLPEIIRQLEKINAFVKKTLGDL
ncbi:MAG TPA: MBL fold metallo-hydrolase, partial [Petrimonas sp.]|nr:MBL fold metallo-hydrolase [Petrimonas sp.]